MHQIVVARVVNGEAQAILRCDRDLCSAGAVDLGNDGRCSVTGWKRPYRYPVSDVDRAGAVCGKNGPALAGRSDSREQDEEEVSS